MEQQKLPNGVLAIILSIVALLCCCIGGIGFIPAGIAYFLASKSEKMGLENPDQYDNHSQIKTAKILALVALIINVLYLVWTIYRVATVGWDEIMEQFNEAQKQFGA
ncbi:MAG: Trk-type K+ transport system membrane component [Dokdonia sp.]|jgi:Trk-type K+ transport system membrane component